MMQEGIDRGLNWIEVRRRSFFKFEKDGLYRKLGLSLQAREWTILICCTMCMPLKKANISQGQRLVDSIEVPLSMLVDPHTRRSEFTPALQVDVSQARMLCGTGQLGTQSRVSFHKLFSVTWHILVKELASKTKTFCTRFKAQICTHKWGPFEYAINLPGFARSSASSRAFIALWRPAKPATVCCCQWLAGSIFYTGMKVFYRRRLNDPLKSP